MTSLILHFSEGLDGDLEDLIDDNPVNEEEASENEEGGKRKHEDSELEEDLSDDDYALIEENLGIKVKRKVLHSLSFVILTKFGHKNTISHT